MATELAAVNSFDRECEITRGVISDDQLRTAGGAIIREITYRCPVSGKTFRFIANATNLQPGVIAHLYKIRWDIEKVFDMVKNRPEETKAWGKSEAARIMQAQFLCIAHNLLLLMEHHIEKSEGISNCAEKRRCSQRLAKTISELDQRNAGLPALQQAVVRITQRSSKFIRWIRTYLVANTESRGTSFSSRESAHTLIYDARTWPP